MTAVERDRKVEKVNFRDFFSKYIVEFFLSMETIRKKLSIKTLRVHPGIPQKNMATLHQTVFPAERFAGLSYSYMGK